MTTPPLSDARRFTAPLPGEDLADIAARCLPERTPVEGLELLQSWNLHLFARQPSGRVLGADIVFLEPPRPESASA